MPGWPAQTLPCGWLGGMEALRQGKDIIIRFHLFNKFSKHSVPGGVLSTLQMLTHLIIATTL